MRVCVQVVVAVCTYVCLCLFALVCVCFVLSRCSGVWEGSVCRVSKSRKERKREGNEKE